MLRKSQNCVDLYKDLVDKSNLVNIPCDASKRYILGGDMTAEICCVDVNKFDIAYVYFCFCDEDDAPITAEEHLLIFTSPIYSSLGCTANYGKVVVYGNLVKYYVKSAWCCDGIIIMGSWTKSGFCITKVLAKQRVTEKKLLNLKHNYSSPKIYKLNYLFYGGELNYA